eukprot:10092848-Lingulodinium_polyedra.AAC.1
MARDTLKQSFVAAPCQKEAARKRAHSEQSEVLRCDMCSLAFTAVRALATHRLHVHGARSLAAMQAIDVQCTA